VSGETKTFLQESKVEGYLFASVNRACGHSPFVIGAALSNAKTGTTDVHLKSLHYRRSYFASFVSRQDRSYCNKITGEVFATEAACHESLFKNHKDLIESLHPALNLHKDDSLLTNKYLYTTDIGAVRLPVSDIVWQVQVGNDVSEDPVGLLLAARKGGKQVYYLVTVTRIDGALDISGAQLRSEMLDKMPSIDRLLTINPSLIVVQHGRNLGLFDITLDKKDLKCEIRSRLLDDTDFTIVKVDENGVFVKIDGKITQILTTPEASEVKQQSAEDADEAELNFDADQLSIKHLEAYEQLMKGLAVPAISNTTVQRRLDEPQFHGRPLTRKHTWVAGPGQAKSMGPLEIEFQQATNLISLNFDLVLSCESLDTVKAEAGEADAGADQIVEKKEKAHDQATSTLGQFSLKTSAVANAMDDVFKTQSAAKKQEEASAEEKAYLPLLVHEHKGAQFNNGFPVANLLDDNPNPFVSNYPRPHVYFRHAHNECMTVEKITVRSQSQTRSGAHALGGGLIFVADCVEAFDRTQPFSKFNKQEYEEWRAKRIQDSKPLQPFEPVAFFDFENSQAASTTVELDEKRSCRFIMLKPTGLR
jgi:hypothetical protein